MLNIVGHRGLPAHYPENTLEGITAALSAGAKGVEIDIQFSKDGEPVLLHDVSLKRVTGLSGEVSAFDLELLTKMSAHEPERFGEAFLPTPIAALQDVVPVMQSFPKALIFVEIKDDAFMHVSREAVVNKVQSVLADIAEQVVIISYDLEVLRLVRDTTEWPTGWVLTHFNDEQELLAKSFQPEYLICNHQKLPTDISPLWQGLWQWFIYDVTDASLAEQLSARGVNWVESWDVEQLYNAISEPA